MGSECMLSTKTFLIFGKESGSECMLSTKTFLIFGKESGVRMYVKNLNVPHLHVRIQRCFFHSVDPPWP